MRHSRISSLFATSALAAGDAPKLEVRNTADGGAEVFIYDAIDAYFGVSAKMIAGVLNQDKSRAITLRINSPGGDVFEARAIASLIRGHGGQTKAIVDGIAASAATTVALAASRVEMAAGAFFMVHRAWTMTAGNKSDLRELADLLEKIDGAIADDYARKTGATPAAMLKAMDAETWYTADEALAAQFVDAVVEAPATFKNFRLEAFDHVPEALVAAMTAPPKVAAPAEPDFEAIRAHAERRLKLFNYPA